MESLLNDKPPHLVLDAETGLLTSCLDGYTGVTAKERAAHAEIIQRAHSIWESAGRPENRELDHWLQAEAEVRQEG